ncbi:MAG: hypothetical protein M3309_08005 [Actinomycetota bacterium]|nr:hypothetical protein [Actinomycetota bacterium]
MEIRYYEETDSAVNWLRNVGLDTMGGVEGEDLRGSDPCGVVFIVTMRVHSMASRSTPGLRRG